MQLQHFLHCPSDISAAAQTLTASAQCLSAAKLAGAWLVAYPGSQPDPMVMDWHLRQGHPPRRVRVDRPERLRIAHSIASWLTRCTLDDLNYSDFQQVVLWWEHLTELYVWYGRDGFVVREDEAKTIIYLFDHWMPTLWVLHPWSAELIEHMLAAFKASVYDTEGCYSLIQAWRQHDPILGW